MKHIFKQDLKVLSSQTDTKAELGLVQSLALAQDNMCEYFKAINCDGISMIPAKGRFFVLTKSVIRFDECVVKWLDKIALTTQLCNLSKIKLSLQTEFHNVSGERFATCVQELCTMDSIARKLRTIESTSLPKDIEVTQDQVVDFSKFDTDGLELIAEDCRRVDITNIDMYKHVNNLEYVKFALSVLDVNFVESIKIRHFEIHYLSEAKFGEALDIRCYKGDGRCVFQIYSGEKLINRSIVLFDNI